MIDQVEAQGQGQAQGQPMQMQNQKQTQMQMQTLMQIAHTPSSLRVPSLVALALLLCTPASAHTHSFHPIYTALLSTAAAISASTPTSPPNFAYIKPAQLAGIIAGVLVFLITIGVVFYLLYASGSLGMLARELRAEGGGEGAGKGGMVVGGGKKKKKKQANTSNKIASTATTTLSFPTATPATFPSSQLSSSHQTPTHSPYPNNATHSPYPPPTPTPALPSAQMASLPELYDDLLLARTVLPLTPTLPPTSLPALTATAATSTTTATTATLSTTPTPTLTGPTLLLRTYSVTDADPLQQASDGSALYHECAYDPARLWGWGDWGEWGMGMGMGQGMEQGMGSMGSMGGMGGMGRLGQGMQAGEGAGTAAATSAAGAGMLGTPCPCPHCPQSLSLTMVDRELGKPIGLLTLADNSPRHLTLRIEHLWLTPAFQNRGRSLEALMLVLQWLMAAGYRRITAEVDERHLIGRKLLLSAGFLLEAVLRKHKIIQNRNSNTALYVLLNSEWELAQEKLRRKLGIKVKGGVKVAGVVGGVGVRGAVSASAPISAPAPALASASDGSNSSRSGDSSSISNNSSNSSSSSSRRKKKSKGDA